MCGQKEKRTFILANHIQLIASDKYPTCNVGSRFQTCCPPILFLNYLHSTSIFLFYPTRRMSINSLRPQNSQNARSVGVNAFKRFLEAENVTLEYIFNCMTKDPNGGCIKAVMDKFALHLVFVTGVKEKQLATDTAMSYFRHV